MNVIGLTFNKMLRYNKVMIKPRDYQINNIKDILQKLQSHQRCLYYAPTGAGKTTFAALLAREAVKHNRQIRFYVHRDRLVGQTVKTFEKVGLNCGIVAGGYKYHRGCPVQVVSVQTLASGQRDFTWLETGDRKPLSFVDECLIGSTLILTSKGLKRIDDPSIVGTQAVSFNEKDRKWEFKRILAQKCNGEKEVMMITTESGERIVCTKNHLIWTEQGWKEAGTLKNYDKLKRIDGLKSTQTSPKYRQKQKDLFTAHYWEILASSTHTKGQHHPGLHTNILQNNLDGHYTKLLGSKTLDSPLKQPKMQVMAISLLEAYLKHLLSSKTYITPYVLMEENALPLNGLGQYRTKGLHGGTWTTDRFIGQTHHKLDQVLLSTHKDLQKQKTLLSGNGWTSLDIPLELPPPNTSREAKYTTTFQCVTMCQKRSWMTWNNLHTAQCSTNLVGISDIQMLGDRQLVYDIEVEDNHNYIANGVLVHNCHITAYYDVMQKLFPMLPNDRTVEDEGFVIGLTGTPWRLKTDESMGQFYKQLVCAPSYAELISLGYLVEPVYYRVRNEPGGDMEADIEFCISQWKDKAQGSSTFLFTSSVAFANLACEKFNNAGIPSAVVTGKTSRKQRDRIFSDFEREKTKVLISKDVLSEGCDIPKARVALFAAFTESKAKFVQRAGRVLRTFTYPDGRKKNDCIILDQMGLLRRLTPSGLEGITVDESILQPPDPKQPGEMPMKECPECDRLNWISARFCLDCGYEFEIMGTERSRPSGAMDRFFPDLEKKMQFAFYQRKLKKAWLDDKPPSQADLEFLKKFGRFAPLDWKRESVLKNGTPEEKELYRQYLIKHAPKGKNATTWAEGQLSLHLGI